MVYQREDLESDMLNKSRAIRTILHLTASDIQPPVETARPASDPTQDSFFLSGTSHCIKQSCTGVSPQTVKVSLLPRETACA